MKIYVAGPMTNYPLHNFPAFDRAKERLLAMGHEVVSPADIDRSMGITEHTPFEECLKQMKKMLRADVLAIIDECNGMYMLNGWEKSTGARAEHALAVWMGIPIFYEMALTSGERITATEVRESIVNFSNPLRPTCS